ncbi:cyclic nucleotide-binding domain-containing protein [Paenibacillus sp. FSL R5-0407]|uniref:Crp/Fnr family transcriptional regulator n=1 Tax=Paenibacillus sp. FSL R5-0407 TaxID=2975320 RepID=UPI0030FA1168
MKEILDMEILNSHLQEFDLEPIFTESLKPHMTLYSYDAGELVCSQGDPSGTLYVLVKGKLKIYTTSAEGRTLVLCFKTPLELVGDIEYVKNTDIVNTVEAVTPVQLIGIPYRQLKKYVNDHAPFLQFLLDIITQKFYIKSNSFSFNLMYPVEVRLASYLLSVSSGESDELLHEQLSTAGLKDAANLIGVSYRHLNRIVYQFCSEGLVERSKGGIIVKNREGLRALTSHNIYE